MKTHNQLTYGRSFSLLCFLLSFVFFPLVFQSSLPLQLLPSKHGLLSLLTPPISFSSRSFLPLQDFPSLHFPVPNSSKTLSRRFPKLLFIPCSLLILPTFLLFFLSRLHLLDFPTASLFGKIPPTFLSLQENPFFYSPFLCF